LTFSRNETALPTALSTTGLEYASFLVGQVDNAGLSLYGPFNPHQTTFQYGFYGQDDFKLTPRITLNLGLRLDLYAPTSESHNYYAMMDPTKPNPAAGNLPGAYVFAGKDGIGKRLPLVDGYVPGVGPRVGIAWKLSNRLVLRSGYAISYFETGAF